MRFEKKHEEIGRLRLILVVDYNLTKEPSAEIR